MFVCVITEQISALPHPARPEEPRNHDPDSLGSIGKRLSDLLEEGIRSVGGWGSKSVFSRSRQAVSCFLRNEEACA